MILKTGAFLTTIAVLALTTCLIQASSVAQEIAVFNDNGGWCWFQDERAIVLGDKPIFGSVANTLGTDGAIRGGSIEVTTVDVAGNAVTITTTLHPRLENDDHAVPARHFAVAYRRPNRYHIESDE